MTQAFSDDGWIDVLVAFLWAAGRKAWDWLKSDFWEWLKGLVREPDPGKGGNDPPEPAVRDLERVEAYEKLVRYFATGCGSYSILAFLKSAGDHEVSEQSLLERIRKFVTDYQLPERAIRGILDALVHGPMITMDVTPAGKSYKLHPHGRALCDDVESYLRRERFQSNDPELLTRLEAAARYLAQTHMIPYVLRAFVVTGPHAPMTVAAIRDKVIALSGYFGITDHAIESLLERLDRAQIVRLVTSAPATSYVLTEAGVTLDGEIQKQLHRPPHRRAA